MPHPGLLHPEPLPLRQTAADPALHRRRSDTVLAQSLWGLRVLVHKVCVSSQSVLPDMGFDSKLDFTPPTILLGLLLFPWMWGIFFFGGIHHSPVNGCSAENCNFGVLAGENEHMSFYSAILKLQQISIPFSRGFSQPCD